MDPNRTASDIRGLIASSSAGDPDAPALIDVEGATLSYGQLLDRADAIVATVSQAGVGPDDVVAVLLPNGVDLATAFLGVTAAAACAPLNPTYTEPELEFFLDDLRAAAVITSDDDAGVPIRGVADRRGIPIVSPSDPSFLRSSPVSDAGQLRKNEEKALVLHTSGTTARPKQVPLSHANVCASARAVAATLRLAPRDRCLEVMPLFHIHGIVAGLLAGLATGASVVCTPGFDPTRFFDWVEQLGPTWYTAVPTIHQAVLSAATTRRDQAARAEFRFVRSSSAALPPRVLADLEATFDCPVIEAYGMTEAAHQIASNPLPPATCKPGTVGIAAGADVAIMDDGGRLVPAGGLGEIVIRGQGVTAGYTDPRATAEAFVDGWFHTGDQGTIDADGYVTIRSRIKELINRGGEKVAPREIEEALLQHDGVAEAVAFAVPHPTLGEDVGAAIVPVDGEPDQGELRRFLLDRLAPYKVPRVVQVLDELPRGATGKLRRIGLAETLDVAPASDAVEADLARVWAEVLRVESVGVDDDFFVLGGDSLSGVELLARVAETCGVEVPVSALFDDASTVRTMARFIESGRAPAVDAPDVRAGDGPGPLSFAQERLWFLHALEPANVAYNEHLALWLDGQLDVPRLRAALDELERRHETFRTSFPMSGARPVAVVGEPAGMPLAVEDMTDTPDAERLAWRRAAKFVRWTFDLTTGPVARARLYRVERTRHLLVVAYHHVAADGRAREIFRDELVRLYAGEELAPPPVRYADLAA